MADEAAPQTAEPTQETAQPTTAAGGQTGETANGATFTPDQQALLNRLLADERRSAERKIKDSDDYKQAVAAAKKLAELEAAQKSAEERLTAERDQYKTQAEQLSARYRDVLIRSHFTALAAAKGVPPDRLDAAYKLADLAAVEVDEDGTVKGVEKAVESLPKWLSEPARPPVPDINSGGGTNQPDPAAREAEIRAKYRL